MIISELEDELDWCNDCCSCMYLQRNNGCSTDSKMMYVVNGDLISLSKLNENRVDEWIL